MFCWINNNFNVDSTSYVLCNVSRVTSAIGLCSSIIPLIVYRFSGTSKQLAIDLVAMISLLIIGIAPMAKTGSTEYIYLVILVATLVGIIQLLMGILKLGFLTNFMSHPVVSGFTSAAALIIGFLGKTYLE